MAYKIPVLRVNLQYGASYDQLQDIPGMKEVIMEQTIAGIKEAVKKKKVSIPLFEVAGSDYYIELKKDKFKSSLETVLEYYVKKEEYSVCIECRDLINSL
jgi:hypothetical protein